jgi:hypothetical protein
MIVGHRGREGTSCQTQTADKALADGTGGPVPLDDRNLEQIT